MEQKVDLMHKSAVSPMFPTREGQKVYSEIGCKVLEFLFEPKFSVIEILTGTLIDPHELARADRFSDEVYGDDLRRVKISTRANLAMNHSFA